MVFLLKELEEVFFLVREFLLEKGRSMKDDIGFNPKGDVTKGFDLKAEELVIDYCRKNRLPVEILTEEKGRVSITDKPKYLMVVDPVDGSLNFSRGIEDAGVSLAVLPHGKLLLNRVKYALIGNVFTGTVFKAEKNKGAFRNKKRIKASGKGKLSESIFYINNTAARIAGKAEKTSALINRIYRVKCLGSASLELAYVSDGSCEGCLIDNVSPENFAAAYLIIKEAGGVFTDDCGHEMPELDMKKGYNVVASCNKKLHEQVLGTMK